MGSIVIYFINLNGSCQIYLLVTTSVCLWVQVNGIGLMSWEMKKTWSTEIFQQKEELKSKENKFEKKKTCC